MMKLFSATVFSVAFNIEAIKLHSFVISNLNLFLPLRINFVPTGTCAGPEKKTYTYVFRCHSGGMKTRFQKNN